LEFNKSYSDFKKLYYGNLNLYQDHAIEVSSDSLVDKIENLIQHHDLKLMKDTGGVIKRSVDSIQNDICELARLCNLSLHKTYGVNLDKSN
jgi:isopentenyl phosphate kinase